jgi:hypothetical protein
VTRRTGCENSIGRATGALRVGPVRIKPEPQRDADRVRQGLEQRNGTVDTTTHRDGNPSDRPRSPKHRPDRVGKRINSECRPTHRSSLEQSQPNKRTLEPRSISLDDPFAVELEPNKSEFGTTRRITDELNHKLRLAAIPASAGSAGARHPRPKGSPMLFDRREVIMPRRRRGGLRDVRPNPAVACARCEPG